MSSTDAAEETDVCCTNCGMLEVDEIKLEECTDCHLVRYCGDNCRENHREEHEEECKNRKALLHERKLFTQPEETHLGECPICFLPMPIDRSKSGFYSCCSEFICKGCVLANFRSTGDQRCSFCREPQPNKEEFRKRLMKRVKANDPVAMNEMGIWSWSYREKGDYYGAAFECFTKAAELGDADAHYRLGNMYMKGEGVEEDEEKTVYHWEKAAIGGHPNARNNLAAIEEKKGNMGRAVKHLIIAANLGLEISMKALWANYSLGNITKEDLDATLRTHQAAVDETKSEQRDIADKYYRKR